MKKKKTPERERNSWYDLDRLKTVCSPDLSCHADFVLKMSMQQRKKELQELDNRRQKNEALEEIDLKAKDESEYLLRRANQLRQEQEDEIKHLNEVREQEMRFEIARKIKQFFLKS